MPRIDKQFFEVEVEEAMEFTHLYQLPRDPEATVAGSSLTLRRADDRLSVANETGTLLPSVFRQHCT